jgi:hypothetical protein
LGGKSGRNELRPYKVDHSQSGIRWRNGIFARSLTMALLSRHRD